jgi:hypothetical protein
MKKVFNLTAPDETNDGRDGSSLWSGGSPNNCMSKKNKHGKHQADTDTSRGAINVNSNVILNPGPWMAPLGYHQQFSPPGFPHQNMPYPPGYAQSTFSNSNFNQQPPSSAPSAYSMFPMPSAPPPSAPPPSEYAASVVPSTAGSEPRLPALPASTARPQSSRVVAHTQSTYLERPGPPSSSPTRVHNDSSTLTREFLANVFFGQFEQQEQKSAVLRLLDLVERENLSLVTLYWKEPEWFATNNISRDILPNLGREIKAFLKHRKLFDELTLNGIRECTAPPEEDPDASKYS